MDHYITVKEQLEELHNTVYQDNKELVKGIVDFLDDDLLWLMESITQEDTVRLEKLVSSLKGYSHETNLDQLKSSINFIRFYCSLVPVDKLMDVGYSYNEASLLKLMVDVFAGDKR